MLNMSDFEDIDRIYKITWYITNAVIVLYSLIMLLYISCYRRRALGDEVIVIDNRNSSSTSLSQWRKFSEFTAVRSPGSLKKSVYSRKFQNDGIKDSLMV
jgi:hypothetical protein